MGNSSSAASSPSPRKAAHPPVSSPASSSSAARRLQGKVPSEIPEDVDTDSDDDYYSESGEKSARYGRGSGHAPQPQAKLVEKTWYQKASSAYESLVTAIIRPPRSQYTLGDLGPEKFTFCSRQYQRRDFKIKNLKDQTLCCSMWEPSGFEKKGSKPAALPCVIYMHGNSSNRREAISVLSLVLSLGATLCTLDFAGSGHSDGEYVSLGVHEKDDLQCLIQHLRDSGKVSKISCYGRSMGAATALLYARRDSSLSCIICDSPFSSLVALAEGMVEMGRKHGVYAPGFLISLAIRFIRSSVLERAEFDVFDLNPAEEGEHSILPLLLIAAESDAFIPPSHSQLIYHQYGGPKHALLVPGDHNSIRPKRALDTVAIFLANCMQIPDASIISEGLNYSGQPPWLQDQQLVHKGGGADLGVGMNRLQQEETRSKVLNLISGGGSP